MVTRISENEVTLSEVHRWAEDLDAGVARVMRENLWGSTGASQIVPFPWLANRNVRYAIEVDILRFEGNAAGMVELWAAWRVRDGATHEVLVTQESRISQQASGATHTEIVRAQSQAIRTLTGEVAATVRGIE
jgi:uncharacterized lipoprotein YmbA